jgi:nucleotide-binding universal stress UspA family protein
MYSHILVPLDGSSTSRAGLREALALARDQGATLRLLHVVDPSSASIDMLTGANYASVHEDLRRQAKALLDRARRMARRRSVPCDAVVRDIGQEGAVDGIVAAARAWPCDLIVMGTHGRSGLPHLLGSTALGVLRHAPAPVLIVRPPR